VPLLIDSLLSFVKVCHCEVSTEQVRFPKEVFEALKLCYLLLLGRAT